MVPLAGTWIEIRLQRLFDEVYEVVPLAGTWIEIRVTRYIKLVGLGRSPCGDVD